MTQDAAPKKVLAQGERTIGIPGKESLAHRPSHYPSKGVGTGRSGYGVKERGLILTFAKKLINGLMKDGKRGVVEGMLQQCCAHIKMKNQTESRRYIYQAIRNAKPLIGLKNLRKQRSSRRQRAKAVPILTRRAEKLAIQWIIEGAKLRSERTMSLRLYNSLSDAYRGKGYAVKRRDELHRACKLNILSKPGTK